MSDGCSIMDDGGNEVLLDRPEAANLFAVTGDLDAATVSACLDCRSRIVAAVAFVDLLDAAPPLARGNELIRLADDAPTLHLYVVDLGADCAHTRWLDPLYEEWCDAVEAPGPHAAH